MSVAGIASHILTALSSFQSSKPSQTGAPNFESEMSALGQDLQSGNLGQAQSDFASLSQTLPSRNLATPSLGSSGTSSLAPAFNQLGEDLKSGNLSAAQRDYATIQLDLKQNFAQLGIHRRHHHGEGLGVSSSGQQTNPVGPAQAYLQQITSFPKYPPGGMSGPVLPGATGSLNLLA
jgi:hypothetical protein